MNYISNLDNNLSIIKEMLTNALRAFGADTRYKPPIIHMYGRRSKKKTAQPGALWMKPVSYWA